MINQDEDNEYVLNYARVIMALFSYETSFAAYTARTVAAKLYAKMRRKREAGRNYRMAIKDKTIGAITHDRILHKRNNVSIGRNLIWNKEW